MRRYRVGDPVEPADYLSAAESMKHQSVDGQYWYVFNGHVCVCAEADRVEIEVNGQKMRVPPDVAVCDIPPTLVIK